MRAGVGVYSSGPSGVPVAVLETALALRRHGVEVTVFATHDAQLPPSARELSPSLVRLEPLPEALRNPRVEQALHLPYRLLLGRRVARALAEHPVDVLHAFSPGIAATLPRSLPVVVQSWFSPPTLRGRLRTMLPLAPRSPLAAAHLIAETEAYAGDRLGYRRADLVLANTEPAAERLRARGIRALCLPPSMRVPERPPPRSASPAALRLVFCAYNLDTPRKGLRHLLDALPLVRGGPLRLMLVGGWSEGLAPAVERARGAGVEVVALGRVERDRYLELLATEADLLVMPSLYEEWGYALFEALSQGVPALTFDRYPFAEVLDERTGLMARAGDPGSLARCLERALAGGLPAPETVHAATRERFGAEAIGPRLVEAYERVAR